MSETVKTKTKELIENISETEHNYIEDGRPVFVIDITTWYKPRNKSEWSGSLNQFIQDKGGY